MDSRLRGNDRGGGWLEWRLLAGAYAIRPYGGRLNPFGVL